MQSPATENAQSSDRELWLTDPVPGYASGSCLQDAYNDANGAGALTCTASSSVVSASNSVFDAPATCTPGDTITVNITSDLTFGIGPETYGRAIFDLAVYTSLSSSDAMGGDTCAHDVLDENLAFRYPNSFSNFDGDGCLEVTVGYNFCFEDFTIPEHKFRSDLEVTCSGTGNVEVENCYVWRSEYDEFAGPEYVVCNGLSAVTPTSGFNCYCETITLPTTIV